MFTFSSWSEKSHWVAVTDMTKEITVAKNAGRHAFPVKHDAHFTQQNSRISSSSDAIMSV